jgi:hypothetical protein
VKKLKLWWPSLGIALIFGINMLVNFPNLPVLFGYPFDIWLIFILFVVEIVFLNHEIAVLKDTGTNVVPDATGFERLETAFPLWKGNTPSPFKVQRYFLPLRQKMVGHTKLVDTEDVHVKIKFYNTDCKELTNLSHEKAFWFNAKPRVQRKTPEDHINIIRASGKAAGVCLIMKKEGEEDLYVFSDDSYGPGTPSIEFNNSMKIPYKNVYINVELSSANIEMKQIWIKLINLGGKKHPVFELINNPCRK